VPQSLKGSGTLKPDGRAMEKKAGIPADFHRNCKGSG